MTADILHRFHTAGITVTLDGGRVLCSPSSKLTDELRQAIKDNKAELVDQLRRMETRDYLFRLYDAMGREYTGEDWQRAASIPGWLEELERLEDAFGATWNAGGNPVQELKAIQEYYRVGLSHS